MKILHIIERLSGAGPTRSLISLAKSQRELGLGHEHRVATLARDCYPPALIMAARAGIPVTRQPDSAALRELISSADVVQVSFWHHPALDALLRADWPAARLLLWVKVLGATPPQVVTPDLIRYADLAVATSRQTLDLAGLEAVRGRMRWVPACLQPDRLKNCVPRPHEGFCVTYVGTTNFSKMHPAFVAMSAAAAIPDARFVVCGAGTDEALRRKVEESGAADRFVFRGFVEDIGSVFETTDVFGYPICEGSFATSELALQEAMYAGIPPVVFPHAGIKDLVRNGETGLVVSTEAEYTHALEYLFHNPAERRRLGRNARAYVEAHFTQDVHARAMDALYREMIESPKRERRWPDGDKALRPADRFAASFGNAAPQFRASLAGSDRDAERSIVSSSTLLASGEGGIFQFRNAHPDDPYLRFWAGLALLGQERFPAAQREMQAAAELGISAERVEPWLSAARSETRVC